MQTSCVTASVLAIARPSHIQPALAELLERRDRHDWSINDLTSSLEERGVNADFSSVYRALRRMVDEGSVSEVELGDGKARFEASGEHHEHVRCDECGKVGAVSGCLVERVVPAVERRTGFSITGHRLLLSGRCPACMARAGE
jgi:Fe2+ or Zn2+ uptake regulation protein